MSYTFTLTGKESVISSSFSPPIYLKPNVDYCLGFLDFETYYTVPNVDDTCNIFSYGDGQVELPEGTYEVEDIEAYLKSKIGAQDISLKANNNTIKCEIHSKFKIDFTKDRSIGSLLGFSKRVLAPNITHTSDLPVNIVRFNAITIECNLVSGSYLNDREIHVIHMFSPTAPPGYKILEKNDIITYLPVKAKTIDNITVRILDEEGNLLNFRGEKITVRLHLKQDGVPV